MNKKIRILITWILLGFVMSFMLKPVAILAQDSNVEYRGRAESFVIMPEDTDLFQNFKGVMPGDKLKQEIRVANENTNIMPARIYLRAEPIDPADKAFLEQLTLKVESGKLGDISLGKASETAGLTENVLLGTFMPGTEDHLTVTLDVPIEMNNDYQNAVGEVIWIFTVEEDDPPPLPQTGLRDVDKFLVGFLLISGVLLLVLLLWWRKKDRQI